MILVVNANRSLILGPMTTVKTLTFVETVVWTVGRPNGSRYVVRCIVLEVEFKSMFDIFDSVYMHDSAFFLHP